MTYETVKRVIDQWDPIGLLAIGCPEDEYSIEVKKIVNNIHKDATVHDVTKIIFNVFTEMFGEDLFTNDLIECEEIAFQILSQ